MKKTVLLILLATTCVVASAQLKVTSDGKVKIASSQTTSYANLLVGENQFSGYSTNIGVTSSKDVSDGKNNIGVMGSTNANSSFTSDRNYGVLGIVPSIYPSCNKLRHNFPDTSGKILSH